MENIKSLSEAGLYLLKQAALLYLTDNSPAQGADIGRAIGTHEIEQPQGGQKGWMTGAILGELVREGKVERLEHYEGQARPMYALKKNSEE